MRNRLKDKNINWKPIQERKTAWSYTLRTFYVVIGAFIYYLAVQWFILGNDSARHTNFLSTGSSGILLSITTIFPSTTNFYFLMQLLVNIPLIALSYFTLGKITAFYTLIFVAVQYAYSFIPDPFIFGNTANSTDTTRYAIEIISGILAGVIGAIGASINYNVGSTAGGTDVFIFNINLRKKIPLGIINIWFNVVIIIVGFGSILISEIIRRGINHADYSGILFNIIGTGVYITTFGIALDAIYPRGRKFAIFIIVPREKKVVINKIMADHNYRRTFTQIDSYGGKTNAENMILIAVITAIEYPQLKSIITAACPEAFIFNAKVSNVKGNFANFAYD